MSRISLLPARIAARYLRSRKSHSAVGAISAVSVAGMAVATAAIVCVLSVFNGFRGVIADHIDLMAPDVLVEPTAGKTIASADSLAARLSSVPGVALATPTISDNALVLAAGREMPVILKGVIPADYARLTATPSLIRKNEGRYLNAGLDRGIPEANLSIGVAAQLSAFPGDHMLLFAPKRAGRVNMANPAASFITDSLYVAGVYRAMQNEYDANRVIVDIATARRLFQYDHEASAIEIKATPATDPIALADHISALVGPDFSVKDRLRQQDMNFRMIQIEKWISFLLLGFILLIASFNIISALSMLVLEKEHTLSTLSAIGMSRHDVGSVFAWESIFVSLCGGIGGILLGLVLCLIQQEFGLIKIGDGTNAVIDTYPVSVEATDLILTLLPVIIIGLLTAWITASFARRRISNAR